MLLVDLRIFRRLVSEELYDVRETEAVGKMHQMTMCTVVNVKLLPCEFVI